jgi:hypothetical protein
MINSVTIKPQARFLLRSSEYFKYTFKVCTSFIVLRLIFTNGKPICLYTKFKYATHLSILLENHSNKVCTLPCFVHMTYHMYDNLFNKSLLSP